MLRGLLLQTRSEVTGVGGQLGAVIACYLWQIYDNAILKNDNAILKNDNSILKNDNAILKNDNAILKNGDATLQKDNGILNKIMIRLFLNDQTILKNDNVVFINDNAIFNVFVTKAKAIAINLVTRNRSKTAISNATNYQF